MGLKVVK